MLSRSFHIEYTAEDIGDAIAFANPINAALVFFKLSRTARAIDWPRKCREIGEQLTADQCDRVRETLETLCERLQEAATEQRAAS